MSRTVLKRILILCEDAKSSLLYFRGFRRDENLKRELSAVSIEVFHPNDYSPKGLVIEAKRLKLKAKQERNPYDEIWVVMDKDHHLNLPEALDMASANKIHVALSIICFEYWILLHFEATMKAFNKCDELISYLKRNHNLDYEKCVCCYEYLKDLTNDAITNAKWSRAQLEHEFVAGKKLHELNVYTNVDQIVKKLIDPKKYLI